MSSLDLANQTGLIPQQFYSVSSNGTKIVQANNDGVLLTNSTTSRSLGIGAGGFLANGTYTIDPLNLIAIAPNPTPTQLVINNTLIVQDDNTAPNNIINIQAGQNGGVGTYFGIDYESTTNQDFNIQTTNSNTGGVVFKQYGLGATTTQTKIKQGVLKCSNTANSNAITIDASAETIVLTDGTNTNTINQNGYSTKNTTANANYYLNFSDSSSNGIGAIQKTAGLSVNPSTNTINATTFVGALTGTATSATTATNATNVATTSTSTNATYYPTFVSATSGNNSINVDTTLTYNPSTDTLTCANLAGTATSATTATRATNIAGGLGGSIPYQTAVNTTALLANGTSGQYLKSNGTTLAPSWATLPTTSTPTLSAVMTAGNTASTTLDMSGNNITNCGTITATTANHDNINGITTGTPLTIKKQSTNTLTPDNLVVQSYSTDTIGSTYNSQLTLQTQNSNYIFEVAYLQNVFGTSGGSYMRFGNAGLTFDCINGAIPQINANFNSSPYSLELNATSLDINNPVGNPILNSSNAGTATALNIAQGTITPTLTIANSGIPTILGTNVGVISPINFPTGILYNQFGAFTTTSNQTLSSSFLYANCIFTGNGSFIVKLPSTSGLAYGAWIGITFAPNTTTARTLTIQNFSGGSLTSLSNGSVANIAGSPTSCCRLMLLGNGNWYCV